MDSSVSLEERIWFLRVCQHVPFSLYHISLHYLTDTQFSGGEGEWGGVTEHKMLCVDSLYNLCRRYFSI